jgi:hypothetical protein
MFLGLRQEYRDKSRSSLANYLVLIIIFNSLLIPAIINIIKTQPITITHLYSPNNTPKNETKTSYQSGNSNADVIALSTVKLHGHSQMTTESSVMVPFVSFPGDDGGVMSGVSDAASSSSFC